MKADKIVRALDKLLLPRGFVRASRHWNRVYSPYVDIIFLDVSRHGTGATLEAGVVYQQAHDMVWGHIRKRNFFNVAEATVRASTKDLSESGLNYWWETDSLSNIEAIVACTAKLMVPFVERMRSLDAMRDWILSPAMGWVPMSKYLYLSVIYKDLGDDKTACGILQRHMGAWEEKAKHLRTLFNCNSSILVHGESQPGTPWV